MRVLCYDNNCRGALTTVVVSRVSFYDDIVDTVRTTLNTTPPPRRFAAEAQRSGG